MRLITIKNINKKVVWAALTNSKTIVFSLLMFNFIYRLYIYFNTKLFEFSDYTGYLNAIETIRETGFIPLKSGNAVYLNSYIGYFFKYVVGSMDYYYIFNCFIGTLSSFFIYIFIIRITDNKKAGFIYLGLTSFYSEFVAISSVFYTQVIEIFLASIMINILLTLHRSKKVVPVLIYIVFIVVIINFSFFFKGTMRYLWIVFGLLAIINVKNYRIAIKYLTLTIALYSVNISIATFFPKIDYIFSTTDLNKNSTVYHLFFGHTLYGGDGGEGTFIYPENRSRFKDNYDKWLKNNNVMVPTIETLYQFEKYEIKRFITQHPFQWVELQIYKFMRTFGIVPEGTTFQILFSGLFSFNWIFTSLFLQIPYTLIILLLILCSDYKVLNKYLHSNFTWVWVVLFIYWLCGTIFYGPFQERYRIPDMVLFIIPILSFFISRFSYNQLMMNNKSLLLKAISIILIFSIWTSQAYNALVKRKDRYLPFVENANNINKFNEALMELDKLEESGKIQAWKLK